MRVFLQKHNKKIWGSLVLLFVFLTPISVLTLNLNVTHAFWGDVVKDLGQAISYAILSIGSWLTLAGGRLLELSIEVFVIGFGVLINGGADNVLSGFASSNLGKTVNTVWTLVRDICNLLFIFGFLYIGILLIAKNSSSAKGLLAKLIIMALLVNFSLFLTKVVIESTNVIAYTIYNNMTEGGGKITDSIMDILGLSSIYQFDRNLAELTDGGAVWFFIMAFIFLVITAFVFFAGALMLLTRFVALLFIMMFSPILFAAQIFPATAQHAKTMWKKLFSYSFFAPAYIFLIYVAILVLNGLNIKGDHGYDDLIATAGSEASAASVDSYMVVLNFAVAIIVIQMAASLASKMGLAGGELAVTVANKGNQLARRSIGGALVGGAGALGRGTVGRWSNSISESDSLKNTASQKGLRGFAARRTLRGARVVADSSFDARNVGGAGKKLGVGEGRKGGYKTAQDEVKKKEEEFARSLGTLDDTDVKVKGRKVEMEEEEKKLRTLRAEMQAERDPEEKAEKAQEVYAQEQKISKAKRAYEQEKQRRQIGTTYTEYKNDSDSSSLERIDERIKTHKENVKKGWEKYTTLDDEAKKKELAHMKKLEQTLKRVEDEKREFLNRLPDQGYASVRETSKWWNTWPAGRMVSHEREAGKAIRKSREKGLPKEKGDK